MDKLQRFLIYLTTSLRAKSKYQNRKMLQDIGEQVISWKKGQVEVQAAKSNIAMEIGEEWEESPTINSPPRGWWVVSRHGAYQGLSFNLNFLWSFAPLIINSWTLFSVFSPKKKTFCLSQFALNWLLSAFQSFSSVSKTLKVVIWFCHLWDYYPAAPRPHHQPLKHLKSGSSQCIPCQMVWSGTQLSFPDWQLSLGEIKILLLHNSIFS